ncbi:hypothetical protein HDV00_002006 [Rhizophlyctis rosea]|nr:hypothetical protein HDV00_002006 [Rhizophlyctis rosea]
MPNALTTAQFKPADPRTPGGSVDITSVSFEFDENSPFGTPAQNTVQWITLRNTPAGIKKEDKHRKFLPPAVQPCIQRVDGHHPVPPNTTVRDVSFLLGDVNAANNLIGTTVSCTHGNFPVVAGRLVAPRAPIDGPFAVQPETRLATTNPATLRIFLPADITAYPPEKSTGQTQTHEFLHVFFNSRKDAEEYQTEIKPLRLESQVATGRIGDEKTTIIDRQRFIDPVEASPAATFHQHAKRINTGTRSRLSNPTLPQTPQQQHPNPNNTQPLPPLAIPPTPSAPSIIVQPIAPINAPASAALTPISAASDPSWTSTTSTNNIAPPQPLSATTPTEPTAASTTTGTETDVANGTAIAPELKWYSGITVTPFNRTCVSSWIKQTEPTAMPYIPQTGDFVAYIKAGHEHFVAESGALLGLSRSELGGVDGGVDSVMFGEVVEVVILCSQLEIICVELELWESSGDTAGGKGSVSAAGRVSRPIREKMHPVVVDGAVRKLKLCFAITEEFSDFIIPFEVFVTSIYDMEWVVGERVVGRYGEEEWGGVVESVGEEMYTDCWECVTLKWEGFGAGVGTLSPWEVKKDGGRWASESRVRLGVEETNEIVTIIENFRDDPANSIFIADTTTHGRSQHLGTVAYPVSWAILEERLKKGYYWSNKSVAFDLRAMANNAKQLHPEDESICTAADTLLDIVCENVLSVSAQDKEGKKRKERESGSEEEGDAKAKKVKVVEE